MDLGLAIPNLTCTARRSAIPLHTSVVGRMWEGRLLGSMVRAEWLDNVLDVLRAPGRLWVAVQGLLEALWDF